MEENKNVVANENFDWNSFENDLGVYSQPKEEIAAAYDKTLSNVTVGEVVEGTVTGLTKREVIVNVGYKSEGIISISEFRYNPDLKVGDKIEVYVDSAEDKNGQLASRTRRPVSSRAGIVSTRLWRTTKSSRVTSSAARRAV